MTEKLSELNQRIKAPCEAKGLKFMPWDDPLPWMIPDDEKPHPTLKNDPWWPKMVQLRRRLMAELEQ